MKGNSEVKLKGYSAALGISLVVQRFRLHASAAGGVGSVLDRKTKISLVAEHTSRQKVIQSLLRKVEKVVR